MGNILKKSTPISSVHAALEQDKNFKSITVEKDCQLCHYPIIPPSFKFTNDNNCHHTICTHCISEHLNSKLETEAVKITCPGPNCKAVLDPVRCRGIVAARPYDKWLDRLCYAAILGRDKCYCPHAGCRALIVNECYVRGGLVPGKSKCPNCKRLFCFLCRTAWHEGKACDMSREREMIGFNEMLFMRKTVGLKKKFSRCPKCMSFTELVRKPGFCIVRCRCKTVYCFHCEREMIKLGCRPGCLGFERDIHSYKATLVIRWACIMLFATAALVIWTVFLADPEVYF